MLGGRLYSPNLIDVALLEDAQLLLLISPYISLHFFPRAASRRPSNQQILQTMYRGKLEKLTERLLAKLNPPNLVNTIFHLAVGFHLQTLYKFLTALPTRQVGVQNCDYQAYYFSSPQKNSSVKQIQISILVRSHLISLEGGE